MTRERFLIINNVFCDTNLYPDGPKTLAEARTQGKSLCPNYDECNGSGFLHPETGHQCAMLMGLQVAQFALKEGHTIQKEMAEFRKESINPPKGWIYSYDRKDFNVVPSGEESLRLIEKFAHFALGGENEEVPEDPRRQVGPDFNDVLRHAATPEGGINVAKMEELEGRFGSNGGRGCDVRSGPCSCGAWH